MARTRILGPSVGRFARSFALAVLWLAVSQPAPAAGQTVVGPSKCTACHDHDRQTTKWQREEPAQYKGKAHYNTDKQLEGGAAVKYAKALSLADPYDVKGACVSCHTTVFRGAANAGVSCESCHGPASNYLEPHKTKGSYAQAVSRGMKDTRDKPAAVARTCMVCHITTNQKLVAAGHPSGAAFDAGAGLRKIVHWAATYDYAQVSAAGKAAMGSAGRSAPAAAPPAAVAPAAAPPVAAKGAAKGGALTSSGAAVVSRAPAPAAAPAAAGSGAADAPWDWSQPVRALPKDYVPEAVPAAAAPPAPAAARAPAVAPPPVTAPVPARAAPVVEAPAGEPAEAPPEAAAPAASGAAPAAARPARPRPARVVVPSLAEDLPVAPAIVVTDSPALASPPPPRPVPAGARSATARVTAARGGAAAVLARVLRDGAKQPTLAPPSPPREFKGPDGELLRLQDEAIALALEALRRE
jgi:hypothetical protein